jgi:probable phosphoglycerate mutase
LKHLGTEVVEPPRQCGGGGKTLRVVRAQRVGAEEAPQYYGYPRPPMDTAPDATQVVPQPTLGAETGGTTLMLIRHGRSADVVPGTPEAHDPELHEAGHRQVRALAARLAETPIDGVYASRLKRAVATARPLAAARQLPVQVIDDLEEVRLGDWANGEFRRRAAVRDPEWLAWSRTGRWDGVPGCEGDEVFRHRVRGSVDQAIDAHPGGTVAVVAHGGSINAYLAELLGVERSLFATIENTSISVVRIVDGIAMIVTVNDCNHLYDPVIGPQPGGTP